MIWQRLRQLFNTARRDALLDPDEVLLDASNLPEFDTHQLEGRVARSIRSHVPLMIGVAAVLVFAVFLFQSWNLQVARGEALALLSERNTLDRQILFAERGIIYDRFGRELAWNSPNTSATSTNAGAFALRSYADYDGIGHTLGFVGYPQRDTSGNWWRTEYVGKAGAEQLFNDTLSGENGVRVIEVDALGRVQSSNTVTPPTDGRNVYLSIDAELQQALYRAIRDGAQRAGFVGGSGVVMDVESGEILALVSYPEYDSQVMTEGADDAQIAAYARNEARPFLNRAVAGLYTPGSIVKPFIAAAALAERIIDPQKAILSTGELVVPNPYDPDNPSVFRDWKAHGWVNMRRAIAVSSDVYFYQIGGGFESQKGLGIGRIEDYMRGFGFGQRPGSVFDSEVNGVIPNPAWKERVFDGDVWRVGDTYITAIGQYGFQVSPLQVARATAALAHGSELLTPVLERSARAARRPLSIEDTYLQVAREGMRLAVVGTDDGEGTAQAVNVSGIAIAAKTGTAEVGANKEWMNSWVNGFWPAEDPQFAFAVVLERAPADTLQGAAPASRPFFEWLVREYPTYARGEYPSVNTAAEAHSAQ